MTLRFVDGFDHYNSAQLSRKWTSVGSGTTVTSTNARNGQCTFMNSSSHRVVKNIQNAATVIIGFGFRIDTTINALGAIFSFGDTATAQITITSDISQKLTIKRGIYSGTTLATSTVALLGGIWYYIECKATIDPTVGYVEVRLNGLNVVSYTGNTRNSANSVINNVSLNGDIGSTNDGSSDAKRFDDVYVCDSAGTVNNDFLGDVKVEALYPSGIGNITQWTPNAGQTWGQLTTSFTSGNIGLTSGTIIYAKVTAPFSGTVTQIQGIISSAITGKVNAALYSDVSGVPATLLGQGTELTNPTTGTVTFTLSPATVTKNNAYWIALWANTSANVFNGAFSVTTSTQFLAYSSTFPATATGGSVGTSNGAYLLANVTSIPTYQLVSEQDDDVAYVSSSTLTQKDTYTMSNLAANPNAIIGVQTVLTHRKDDAGSRTVTAVIRSGGADYDGAAASVLDSYSCVTEVKETDPATGVAWTPTGVNSMETGVKVVS